ncbi:hypothetical protein MTMN5_03546 [Marinobacter salarius]|nr:hypothetical protein MTMN5_03546 [Marinobacter salarius]
MNGQSANFWIENLPLLTDVIVAIAAIITACVAVYGVTSWKRELKQQTKHKTAANLKAEARKLQRALKLFRDPRLFSNEFPPDYQRDGPITKKNEGKVLAFIYENRLRRLSSAFESFEQTAIEAEAILGRQLEETFNELFMLQVSAETCYQRLAPDFSAFFDYRDKFDQSAREFLQGSHDGSDLRSKAFQKQFQDLESFLDKLL